VLGERYRRGVRARFIDDLRDAMTRVHDRHDGDADVDSLSMHNAKSDEQQKYDYITTRKVDIGAQIEAEPLQRAVSASVAIGVLGRRLLVNRAVLTTVVVVLLLV